MFHTKIHNYTNRVNSYISYKHISSDASKLLLINNTFKITQTNKHFSWDPLYMKHKNSQLYKYKQNEFIQLIQTHQWQFIITYFENSIKHIKTFTHKQHFKNQHKQKKQHFVWDFLLSWNTNNIFFTQKLTIIQIQTYQWQHCMKHMISMK